MRFTTGSDHLIKMKLEYFQLEISIIKLLFNAMYSIYLYQIQSGYQFTWNTIYHCHIDIMKEYFLKFYTVLYTFLFYPSAEQYLFRYNFIKQSIRHNNHIIQYTLIYYIVNQTL